MTKNDRFPLVSVIIPVYRTEEYLDECMGSVLLQTYKNLEIILVDDGSPDKAPQLCDEYGQRDSRVRVIHRENGGLSAARNSGKAIAQGEYLTFLDSDDIWAPEMVAHMVDLAQRENAQVVKVGVIRKYTKSQCVSVLKDYIVTTGMGAMERIFWDNSQIITICGKLFKADLFEGLDFPLGLYYEDEYTTPRIYRRAQTVVLSESELYFYMQRDNESILRGALNDKRIHDSLFVTADRIEYLKAEKLDKLVKKAVQDHYIKLQRMIKDTAEIPGLNKNHSDLLEIKSQFERKYPLQTVVVRFRQRLFTIKQKIMGKC